MVTNTLGIVKTYKKCYAGDCRYFFNINERYSGYVSRDGKLYFVYDKNTNKFKDYTAEQLEQFIKNISGNVIHNDDKKEEQALSIELLDKNKLYIGAGLAGILILIIILTK